MENRKELRNEYPTAAQLYALEIAARRHRSQEMGRLIAAAAAAVKGFFSVQGRINEVRHA